MSSAAGKTSCPGRSRLEPCYRNSSSQENWCLSINRTDVGCSPSCPLISLTRSLDLNGHERGARAAESQPFKTVIKLGRVERERVFDRFSCRSETTQPLSPNYECGQDNSQGHRPRTAASGSLSLLAKFAHRGSALCRLGCQRGGLWLRRRFRGSSGQ
jgi:hypothetical protein